MPFDLSQYVRIARIDLPEPTRTTAPVGNLLAQEVSAITYNQDTDTLFVLGDGGTSIVEISKTGQLIGTMTLAAGSSPQGTEFYDPEGLTYIGNGQFVMTEERDRNLVLFTYEANTTLTRANAQTADLGSFVGNVGFEGVTYDPATGGFIVAKEISPEGVFQTQVNFLTGTSTNGTATTEPTYLFNPALAGLADFADIYALSNVALFDGQATSDHLLLLSQESGRIIEIDRNGTIYSSLNLVADFGNPLDIASQQHEGVTMDDQGFLYVVSENGGGDINHPQLWIFAPSLVANQAPSGIGLVNPVTAMLENTSTAVHIRVASIAITDDGIGTNGLSLSGADAAYFEVDSTGLYVRAGVTLDFETHPTFNVTVNVDDPNVGASPDASTNYTLNLVNILNEGNGPMLTVSEVAPWSSGNSAVAADWFELTNTGTTAINITGWRMDDNSNSFGASVALSGVTSIGAGESVIFIEGGAVQVTAFINTWFGGTPPTGLQIGTYSGSGVGLSTAGDAVNIYNADGVLQANVVFGASPAGPTFGSFDNAAGLNNATISQLSAVGVNAAFAAANQASNVGSPGEIALNVAPIAGDDSLSNVNEDSGARTISFASLLANDLAGPPNEASQALTITAVSNVVGGTAQIVGTDVIFTPDANFNGPASFEYTVQDNGQNYGVNAFLSDTGAVSFAIDAVNDAPTLTGVQSTNENGVEDTAFTVTAATLLTGFSDIDGDTLSAGSVTASSGTVVDNGNGTWTITQAANFNGPVTLSYVVSDGNGGTTAATLPYTVAAVNDAPVLTGAQAALAAGTEDTSYTVSSAQLLTGFSDVDGDTLSVSNLTTSRGSVVDNGDGTFTIRSAYNYNGPVTLNYTVTDGNGGSVAASESFFLAAAADAGQTTGPSSSTPSYLTVLEPNVHLTAIITTGDALTGSTSGVFGGIPDGIGAFDNGDGTITLLVNHEITNTQGVLRDHGSIGSYVDQIVIDKATLAVIGGDDAMKVLNLWNDSTDSWATGTTAFSRFCSGDLADPTAFFNAVSGLGTTSRIYITGEESGLEGRAIATVVSGPDAGKAYELPFMGNMAYENLAANPLAQDRTVVSLTDDGLNGQVYIYVGDKQATGNEVERAGLANGVLYGIKVAGVLDETNGAAVNGNFTLEAIANASNLTGAQIDAASELQGVTSFLRPEDSAWDPDHPNVLYFATTNSFTAPSRLYRATFTDITHPELGGTIEAVLDGTEGQHMFDNITVANGKVILQEDPGNQGYVSRVWEYDIASDRLSPVLTFDPAQFTPGLPGFITQDEESSGVLDVTGIFGGTNQHAYLLDAQVHAATGNPATVERGQLLLLTVDTPLLEGTSGNDLQQGSYLAETFNGYAGNDTIQAGSGNDTINGGADNDTIDGGAGIDTAVYSGNLADYAATRVGSNVTLSGPDGTDTVVNVESFQFADGTRSVGQVGNLAAALTGVQATLASGTEDTAYVVSAANLLAGFTDANGDALSLSNVTASNGTVVDNGNGTYTVTPTANFNGAVTLNYNVVDAFGGSTAATLGYTLTAVNDAPTLVAAQAVLAAGTEDTAYTVSAAQFLQGFGDVDGDVLAVSSVTSNRGAVVDNGNGTWTVTPSANYNGPATLSYSVVDGNGGSVAASLGFSLAAVNDAPTALALSNSTVAENRTNNSVVGTLATTDVDNTSGFTYAMIDSAGGRFYLNPTTGVVSVGNGNLLDYETATSHTITVRVTDAGGLSYTQNLTISLTNVVENQTYTGTAGADVFTAPSPDNWTVDAKGGADIITTLGGNDTIFAGGGNDTVSTGGGNDTIYFTGGGGFDAIDGGSGTDALLANAVNTVIGLSSLTGVEVISSGGFGNVKIQGSTAANVLDLSATTLSGIVEINGGAGGDTIIGSAGSDVISGAAGRDLLTGGAGADTFLYRTASETSGVNADHILDFTSGVDHIDLSGIDANTSLAGNQSFTFIGTNDFTGLGQLRIGTIDGQTVLSGNVSGNLAADFTIFLDNNPIVQATDFIL